MEQRKQLRTLRIKLQQWHLNRQWQAIRTQAAERGLSILVIYHSMSVPTVQTSGLTDAFSVNQEGELSEQSGVPPDYFSDDGQLWGTPVYRGVNTTSPVFGGGDNASNGSWNSPTRCDWIISEHWQPIGLCQGKTQPQNMVHGFVHRRQLLASLKRDNKGILPLIAEDLGVVTPDVEHLRDRFNVLDESSTVCI